MPTAKPGPKRPASKPATSGDVAGGDVAGPEDRPQGPADRPAAVEIAAQSATPSVADFIVGLDEDLSNKWDSAEALSVVRQAIAFGQPLPRHVADWLMAAIDQTLAGASSLDQSLGLNAASAGYPLRSMRRRNVLFNCMYRMWQLHNFGATIEQAAELVASVTEMYEATTLAARYARSGSGKSAIRYRVFLKANPAADELEKLLAEYPDQPRGLKIIKRKIIDMHAKLST